MKITKTSEPCASFNIRLSLRELQLFTAMYGNFSPYSMKQKLNNSCLVADGFAKATTITEAELFSNVETYRSLLNLVKAESEILPVIIKNVEFVYDKEDGTQPKWRKIGVVADGERCIEGFEGGRFKKFLKSRILGGKVITVDEQFP